MSIIGGKNYNKIILASASPRRSELLARAGIPFTVEVSKADEDNSSSDSPEGIVRRNALAKAREVSARFPEATVLGADTIVALGGKIYGKPAGIDDAKRMLAELSGKTHSVFTGVALAAEGGEKVLVCAEESRVKFKKLSAEDIEKYLKSVNVLDKAGAYAAQECGSMIIEAIDGNFDNVMGLSCGLVKKMLKEF